MLFRRDTQNELPQSRSRKEKQMSFSAEMRFCAVNRYDPMKEKKHDVAYERLQGGRIIRCVQPVTFAKAFRPRPAFHAKAPVDSFHPASASACGCSMPDAFSAFHSVLSHPRTFPNRKSIAGHSGDCAQPFRCAMVSGAESACERCLLFPVQSQRDTFLYR